MAIILENAGKAVMLDYIKDTVTRISIGNEASGIAEAHDTFTLTWGTIGSGILDISTTYTNIIVLRYPKYDAGDATTAKSDRLWIRGTGGALITMSMDDISINPTTNGVYAIYSMPITMAVV